MTLQDCAAPIRRSPLEAVHARARGPLGRRPSAGRRRTATTPARRAVVPARPGSPSSGRSTSCRRAADRGSRRTALEARAASSRRHAGRISAWSSPTTRPCLGLVPRGRRGRACWRRRRADRSTSIAARLRAAGAAVADVSSGLTSSASSGRRRPRSCEELCPVDLSARAVADRADRPGAGGRRPDGRSRGRTTATSRAARCSSPATTRSTPGTLVELGGSYGLDPSGAWPSPRVRAQRRRVGAAERRDDRPAATPPDRAARDRSSRRYDVVIIGGGVHGLAIAYELAKRGVKDVAVLDRSYLGSGASGRNTAIIRSNYRTDRGRRVLRRVGEALRGTVGGARVQRPVQPARPPDVRPHRARHRRPARAGRDEPAPRASTAGSSTATRSARLVPALDLSDRPRFPILAALYHPPGGIIRHDAVVWGYARRAAELGVAHPSEHRGHRHRRRRRPGHRRPDNAQGPIRDRHGRQRDRRLGVDDRRRWSGLRLPIVTHPLQALRDRAAQAVPRPGARVRDAPRLRQPDRPRRARHRLGDRSLRVVQQRSTLPFLGVVGSARRWSCCPAWPASRCCASGPGSAT